MNFPNTIDNHDKAYQDQNESNVQADLAPHSPTKIPCREKQDKDEQAAHFVHHDLDLTLKALFSTMTKRLCFQGTDDYVDFDPYQAQ